MRPRWDGWAGRASGRPPRRGGQSRRDQPAGRQARTASQTIVVPHAASTIAAVSTRRMRGPSPTTAHPAARAYSTSSSVNPPSGPTAATTSAAARRPGSRPPGCASDLPSRQVLAPQKVRPFRQRPDLHQDVAAALLAGLDDVPFQLVELRLARMDHAPGGLQRRERRHAQLGQLLDQELRRGRPSAAAPRFPAETARSPLRRLDGLHLQHDALACRPHSPRRGTRGRRR